MVFQVPSDVPETLLYSICEGQVSRPSLTSSGPPQPRCEGGRTGAIPHGGPRTMGPPGRAPEVGSPASPAPLSRRGRWRPRWPWWAGRRPQPAHCSSPGGTLTGPGRTCLRRAGMDGVDEERSPEGLGKGRAAGPGRRVWLMTAGRHPAMRLMSSPGEG